MTASFRSIAIGWCALLALAVAAGCSKSPKATGPVLDVTPAAGTVTLDGKPLADATLTFIFEGQPPGGYIGSGAGTDAEGHYQVNSAGQAGAVPGSYKVTVSKEVAADGKPIDPKEGMDLEQLRASGGVKETIPRKYTNPATTDLKVTIEKGKADGYNLELKSS